MAETHHETVFFTGRVQGVGFRYATHQVAKEYEVAGFVCNLPDGRVKVEAEGTKDEVDAFVASIAEKMHGYIRKVDRLSDLRAPQFQGFSIT
jgi:acylphosphatase